jgi:CBS domain-containing protein
VELESCTIAASPRQVRPWPLVEVLQRRRTRLPLVRSTARFMPFVNNHRRARRIMVVEASLRAGLRASVRRGRGMALPHEGARLRLSGRSAMNVDRIYTRDVIAIPRSRTLKEAAQVMASEHVGCLIVTDDPPHERRAIGIVTDRDMVVQAMAAGLDAHETPIGAVMTPKLAHVTEGADTHRALEQMAEFGVRRLAVTSESGQIIGVLSLDDVVDGIAVEMSDLARILRRERSREAADALLELA